MTDNARKNLNAQVRKLLAKPDYIPMTEFQQVLREMKRLFDLDILLCNLSIYSRAERAQLEEWIRGSKTPNMTEQVELLKVIDLLLKPRQA